MSPEEHKVFLQNLLKKVPASVNNGSIQLVREYKTFLVKARKLLEKQKPKDTDLQSLHRQIDAWFQ